MTACDIEVSADIAEEPNTFIFKVVFIHHLKDGGGSGYL
jgi:hypothetical protein